MGILKMAWRNVWRNQRRTLVTIAAMSFALFVMILYAGLVEGYLRNMERSVLDLEVGDVQVFADGYRDKVKLATKLTSLYVKTRADMDRILNVQLSNLCTEQIDYYLLHGLDHGGRRANTDIDEVHEGVMVLPGNIDALIPDHAHGGFGLVWHAVHGFEKTQNVPA